MRHGSKNEFISRQMEGRRAVVLELTADEFEAVEGWRIAGDLPSITLAVRELTRLGLLSEISKVHSVVAAVRDSIADQGRPD